MKRSSFRHQRGSAILTVVIITAVVAFVVAGLMSYAAVRRRSASQVARKVNRLSCAEAGLAMAKEYFGRNFGQWNAFLNNPAQYNPTTYTNTWPGYTGPAPFNSAALKTARPELYGDIDGDGTPDVYIYIRDNADELPPAVLNYKSDNDQNVFVGAICISPTLNPQTGDGTGGVGPVSPLAVEGLLSYNVQNGYKSQGNCGSLGSGNCNP